MRGIPSSASRCSAARWNCRPAGVAKPEPFGLPRQRTSCTANAPDDASASIKISQPSVLTSSRASRAASCGCAFESRITISICRPARPPAPLIFSTSVITALRDEVPSCATRPERMVDMPILIDLLSARAIIGAASAAAVPAAALLSSARRLKRIRLAFVIRLPPVADARRRRGRGLTREPRMF